MDGANDGGIPGGYRPWPFAALALTLALAVAACGGDDGAGTGAGDAAPAATDTPDGDTTGGDGDAGDSEGPITIEDIEHRCDELTDLVTGLRGEEPGGVEPSSTTDPGVHEILVGDDPGYEVAGCYYRYGDDTFSDPDRVLIGVERPLPDRADDPDVTGTMWDMLAFDVEVDGLGDDARFVHRTTIDAMSALIVLDGATVSRVRVDVPADSEDAPFLRQGALEEAMHAVRERVEP
jgi:hypothetical protein